MASFERKACAKITAKLAGSDGTITVPGVTAEATTTTNAATQINRLVGVVGKQVVKTGMVRTVTEEADDDE